MIAAWVPPDVVFRFLINSCDAIALFVHLSIAVAQVRMPCRLERDVPERLTLTIWLFPWLSRVVVGLMAGVIGATAFLPDSRAQFRLGLLTPAVVLAAYEIRRRVRRSRGSARGQAVRGATDGLHSLMHTLRKALEFTLLNSLGRLSEADRVQLPVSR
ncbi:hypothetical protein [Streptomyces albospinus]|uniref:hypothetical protein n=1 Tax=Streptomyces albospinus TaxID=285515 RepID=UPI001E58A72D|nr:hypothetical protein [Streptomyces albospinus]